MERFETVEIGRRQDGTKIVRNYFINDDDANYMAKAHAYLTKDEKKLAKLQHREKQKSNHF